MPFKIITENLEEKLECANGIKKAAFLYATFPHLLSLSAYGDRGRETLVPNNENILFDVIVTFKAWLKYMKNIS